MSGAFEISSLLLPDVIAHHGRWRAGRIALICGTEQRTWAQFDRETNRIANGLAALGLAPGARLAALMSNSIDMVEVLFGSGKAGVSVVPINVSVSDAAVAVMLEDSGAAWSRLGIDAPAGLGWIDLRAWRGAQSAAAPALRIDADSECNIIYSSGTTGPPKGIVHSHGCRLNWAADLALALRYQSGAVTVCSIGLYSNIMWVCLLCTVLVGGTIVVMPAFSADALLEQVARHRVTHGAFVPVQLQRLLEADASRHDISSLQAIMCCGSPLPLSVKRVIPQRLGCQLIELYGLTEGLITTLDPEDFDRKIDSVGRPVPGQLLKLVGVDDREVPSGEPGEIVGLGRMTMSGYHNRPEATAEATWIDAQGCRWLRTGDIGRLDAEGFLYLVDRKKDQIISGGQNVYPADIEAVLATHPEVAEVAVIGLPSERWGETPVAIVVLGADPAAAAPGQLDAAALRDWANARLGRQQRLATVQFRTSLPRNPNGKVLKRELRSEYAAAP